MRDVHTGNSALTACWLTITAVLAGGVSCSTSDAPKSWNELSTCLVGSAAQGDIVKRVKQLRLIQLSNADSANPKEGWPARCAPYANQLYTAVADSSEAAVMKRKLKDRLSCSDEKPSCTLVNDSSLMSITTELWDAAKSAGFVAQAAPNVALPTTLAEPAIAAAAWKTFSDEPQSVVGPRLTPDGRVVALLKPISGRGKPTACEFPPALDKVKCTPAHQDVPELPMQTVELAMTGAGVYMAGLTETGLVSYNLQTGEKSGVRGGTGALVQDGLALEGGTGDLGFVAVVLKNGKPGKDLKLPIKVARNKPIVAGDQIVWLEQAEGGVEFVAKSAAGAALKDTANLKGAFSGPFHVCQANGRLAVATWEGNAAAPGAKPTAGSDKTQLAVTIFSDGKWSKPMEATLPFERLVDSQLSCTKTGVSVAWAHRTGGVLELSRLDCAADACKATSAKLPGVDSKWWWAVTPVGDKVLMMWRSSLGDTRLRIAPLADLEKTKDVLVFDTPDFGGPSAPDASSLVSDEGALFVFKNERPVALGVASSGAIRILAKN